MHVEAYKARRFQTPKHIALTASLFAVLMVSAPALAQDGPHRFWDNYNKTLIATGAAARAADVVTTKRFLDRGGRERILPDRLVRNTVAFSAYHAAGLGLTALLMYAAHKKGKHKLERGIGWIQTGMMTGLSVNNLAYAERLSWGR